MPRSDPRLERSRIFAVVACFGALTLAGCGAAQPRLLARHLEGHRVVGPVVSGESYEHFLRAELSFSSGDYRAAANEFELARSEGSEDAYLFSRLIEARLRLGDADEVQRLLHTVRELFPNDEATFLVWAHVAEEQSRDSDALSSLAEGLARNPDSERIAIELARLHAEAGRPAQALETLTAFLEREDTSGAPAHRVRLEIALGSGDFTKARLSLVALLRANLGGADDVVRVATSASESGRPLLARTLLEVLPEEHRPRPLWIGSLVDSGELDRAERIVVAAQVAPLERANLFLLAERPERALSTLDLIPPAERSEAFYTTRSEALFATDQIDEALSELDSAGLGTQENAIQTLRLGTARSGLIGLSEELNAR